MNILTKEAVKGTKSGKEYFWLHKDGRPLAHFWRKDDVDFILSLQKKDVPPTQEEALLALRQAIQDCEMYGRVYAKDVKGECTQVTGAIIDIDGDVLIVPE